MTMQGERFVDAHQQYQPAKSPDIGLLGFLSFASNQLWRLVSHPFKLIPAHDRARNDFMQDLT